MRTLWDFVDMTEQTLHMNSEIFACIHGRSVVISEVFYIRWEVMGPWHNRIVNQHRNHRYAVIHRSLNFGTDRIASFFNADGVVP